MRPRTGAVLVPERPAYSLGAIVAVCWLERCVPTEAVRESLDDTELDVGRPHARGGEPSMASWPM